MTPTVIPINELKIGAILPAAIMDASNSNVILLNRGVTVTKENLTSLRRRGISEVAIDTKYVSHIWEANNHNTGIRLQKHYLAEQRQKRRSQSEPLGKKLRKPKSDQYDAVLDNELSQKVEEHKNHLRIFLSTMSAAKSGRAEQIDQIAIESMEYLLLDIDLFAKKAIASIPEYQIHLHSAQTAKLAMAIATVLGKRECEVRHLGMGCMVARLGIDDEMLELMNSTGTLSAIERLEIKKLPGITWHAIEKIADLPNLARQVAWQINERWNGSGYPRGRASSQIHPLARIAGVADAYVAMISERPYRHSLSPFEAVQEMLQMTRDGLFEPESIRGLLKTISLFPIGSYVELQTGEFAEIMRNSPDHYDRPVVKLLCDSQGHALENEFRNLQDEDSPAIKSPCSAEMVEMRMREAEQQQAKLETLRDADDFLDS